MEKTKAIIVGASSGMGKELAIILSGNEYIVGLAARRIDLLAKLQEELPGKSFIKQIDVTNLDEASLKFKELIAEMGGVDLVIISSGTGDLNSKLKWEIEKSTIDVNVTGFALIAGLALHHFLEKGSGHLVSISSIAALRGNRGTPAYSASKAFVSNYIDGLRLRAMKSKKPVYVTDILPGFVKTPMSRGQNLFWVAPAKKAAEQIYTAIRKKKKFAYITRRWRIVALLINLIPDRIYCKM